MVIRQQVCGAHVFSERARPVAQLFLRSSESKSRRSEPTVDLNRVAILDSRLAELPLFEVMVSALHEALLAGFGTTGAAGNYKGTEKDCG